MVHRERERERESTSIYLIYRHKLSVCTLEREGERGRERDSTPTYLMYRQELSVYLISLDQIGCTFFLLCEAAFLQFFVVSLFVPVFLTLQGSRSYDFAKK